MEHRFNSVAMTKVFAIFNTEPGLAQKNKKKINNFQRNYYIPAQRKILFSAEYKN